MTQLTNDGVTKPGTTIGYDGSRLFFTEGEDYGWQIVEVAAAGGDTAPIETTLPHPWLLDIAPDFSGVLATTDAFHPGPLWWQPLPTGTPRRLEYLEASRASFFPDGKHIAYSNSGTGAVGIADRDGSNQQVLGTVKGRTGTLAISPDGQRIRFGLQDSMTLSESLWEVDTKSRSLRQLLVGWPGASQVQGGRWTCDGSHFVFRAGGAGRYDLWALPEKTGFPRRHPVPIRLSNGPISYGFPALSRDGEKIYAEGIMQRGELVRFDAGIGQFVPFLSGLPAIDIAFSKDRKWIAYIAYPDHTLWRCRADGSNRQQITYPPLEANSVGGISPDDTRVTFDATVPGSGQSLFIASLQNGQPRMLLQRGSGGTWSAEGSALLISVPKNGLTSGYDGFELQQLDLSSGRVSSFPDGQSKYPLGWSAQEELVAVDSAFSLQIFSPRTQKWSDLVRGPCATGRLSPDARFAYCETSDAPYHKIVRVRLSDGRTETVTEVKGLRRVVDYVLGTTLGVAPDGSVLLTRDLGGEEIYALNIRWP